MDAVAVVLDQPKRLTLRRLAISDMGAQDVAVDVEWSGISTGTERLLWSGTMPDFPGMGYPLVPGYETVGRIAEAGPLSGFRPGERVFVPGARCFGDVRGLFGGAASRLVVPAARAHRIDEHLQETGVLLALAATALHALSPSTQAPDLIVGHGVLGRLMARIAVIKGGAPTVWETRAERAQGARGYQVLAPEEDHRRDYRLVCDASGDADLLDALIARLAPGGEVVLAGFYSRPLAFSFPPAFMREARIRVAAEWKAEDFVDVRKHIESGRLSLDGLITHRFAASDAPDAYRAAFADQPCLKAILDWRVIS